MKSEMIIERIIKALWSSKIVYSFVLIYSHGQQLEYILTEETWKSYFSCSSQIFGFEKMLFFLLGNMF